MIATDRATRVDEDQFTRIAVSTSPDLLRYIARRVAQAADAPEVLNDALLIAWRRRDRLPRDVVEARKWMFGVARNCVRNHARAWRRTVAHEGPLNELAAMIIETDSAEFVDVRQAVRALPEKYRELIMLIHWDGFTIADAAALLAIRPSTARTRYARARARLRNVLGDP